MAKEKDPLADYFPSPEEEYSAYKKRKREKEERMRQMAAKEEERIRQEQIKNIQSKTDFPALRTPTEKESYLEEYDEEFWEYSEYDDFIPDERDEYARSHGFLNQYDRNQFAEDTRGMYFLQKMNYLIDHADEYGLNDNVYYLLDSSSENHVGFADAIVRECLYNNRDGKNRCFKFPTYSELKEKLETIHDNMIMDVQTIEDLLAQGKSRQWNTKRYKSADGVEFCVFNQLKTPKLRLRAVAFAICHRHWELKVEE